MFFPGNKFFSISVAVNFLSFPMSSSPNLWQIPCDTSPSSSLVSFSMTVVRNFSRFVACSFFSTSSSFLTLALAFLSLLGLVKSLVSTTTPCIEGGAFREASLTSPALSPKMALSNFSSGVGSDSPLGVILPIRISPSLTSVPTLTMPSASRWLMASSLTLGISEVNSSSPSLVSLTANENSSI